MSANNQLRAAVFVQWIDDKERLLNHIQNGVARGLYGQALANECKDRISTLDSEINRVFTHKEL